VADAVQMLSEQLDLVPAANVLAAVRLVGDDRADGHPQLPLPLVKHLADQHECRQRLGDQRGEIERERVAAFDVDRQNGGLGSLGDFQESALPLAIFDAAKTKAGNLAGREHDYRLLAQKSTVDSVDMPFSARAGHIADGQQQGAQRPNGHQQVIGDDLDIRADVVNKLQEGKPIEGADRMVGNDHHFAGSGDVLALAFGYGKAEMKIIQHLLDKFDAVQVGIFFGKVNKCLLMKHSAQGGLDNRSAELAPIEGREMFGNYLIDGKHGTCYERGRGAAEIGSVSLSDHSWMDGE